MSLALLSSPDSVRSPCLEYLKMRERWELIDALIGGTLAMRAGRAKWLPQEKMEEPADYESRLGRSVLYNGYGDTIHKLAAKPFGKPITFDELSSLPEQVQWIVKDATRSGQSLKEWAHEAFQEGVHRGLVHALVDYPVVEGDKTLQDVRNERIYPYFTLIPATNLLGWKSVVIDGQEVLTEVRIREVRTESVGKYGQEQCEYVRVLTPKTWTLYKVENGKESQVKTGTRTSEKMHLHTWYTEKTGFMTGKPALEDLAWINLAHWQSQSDQRNILRFARLGFLVATGLTADEQKTNLIVGPNSVIKLQNPEAKVFYAEHSGKAIAAGDKDLTNLEMKMRILGLQPLIEGGSSTATGSAIEESKTHAQAQTWASEFSVFLMRLFESACEWVQQPMPPEFKISIFTNFAISIRAGLDAQILTTACQTGKLSDETYLDEMKRRGFLNEELDIDEEIERIKAQPPPPTNTIPPGGDKNGKSADNVSQKPGAAHSNEFPSNQA